MRVYITNATSCIIGRLFVRNIIYYSPTLTFSDSYKIYENHGKAFMDNDQVFLTVL